jgi:hypothetical protein
LLILLNAEALSAQIKKAYVVDTINIENPHKAFLRKGGSLLTVYFSGDQLEKVKKSSLKELINDDKVYFTSINFYSFFTPLNSFEKAPGNCNENVTLLSGKNEIYSVSGVDKFIICLINISYFNEKQVSVDYKSLGVPFEKGTFLKAAYSYCR